MGGHETGKHPFSFAASGLMGEGELGCDSRQDAAAAGDSSISAAGSPAEGKGSPGDCVGGAGPPSWGPARSGWLSLRGSPRHCGDPGSVVTSSLFISFSHSLGSQG